MYIFSPNDCFAENVFMHNNSVKKGDKLIELTSPRLEGIVVKLKTSLLINDIKKRQYVDGRQEMGKQSALKTFKSLSEIRELYKEITTVYKLRVQLGILNATEYYKIRDKMIDNEILFLKQKIVVDHFDREVTDSLDKLVVYGDYTRAHLERVERIIASLTISAPIDGVFETAALPGMFFQLGETIGQFYTSFSKRND